MSVIISAVLDKPHNTEKTVGMGTKYTFIVHPDASKTDIKAALKEFYGVEVKSVNIAKNPAKTRVVGRGNIMTKRKPLKKAIVTLKDNAALDFNAFK